MPLNSRFLLCCYIIHIPQYFFWSCSNWTCLQHINYENNAPKQDRFSILLNSTIIFSIQFLRLTIKWQLWFTINKLINQNNPGVTCIKYTNLQLHHGININFNQWVMDNWILHIANLFKKQWNHFNLFGFKIQGDRSN